LDGLLDGVDEPLDVDAGAAPGVLLVHRVGGERGKVEHDVDGHREIVVKVLGRERIETTTTSAKRDRDWRGLRVKWALYDQTLRCA